MRRGGTRGLAPAVCILGLVAVSAQAQIAEWDAFRLDGSASLRLRYDDNIYLADDEIDLERRDRTADGEENDFVFVPGGLFGLTWNASETHETSLLYDVYSEQFVDERDETTVHQSVSLAHRWELCPQARLRTGLAYTNHDQRDGAEYLRPDYWALLPFASLEGDLSERDTVRADYYYETRDYDRIEGTPYDDYHGHDFGAAWKHRWSERWISDLGGGFAHRRYDDPTLDEYGAVVPDRRRRTDDLYRLEAAATYLLSARTALRAAYRLSNNESHGAFYDYLEHRLSALLLHRFAFTEGLVGSAYAHYRNRDYDDRLARRAASSGSDFDFRDDEQSDDQWYFRLRLEKQWNEQWTSDVVYLHIRNESNDDSSEYDDNRVEIGVHYRF